LRQAILQNNVQQLSFKPVYGYPQNGLGNNQNIRSLDFDDDDDDRRIVPQLSFQAQAFQVLARNPQPQNYALNGQFIRQTNPQTSLANQDWVVGNNGQWNQLNVPPSLYSTVNALPNQSYIQGSGQ